MRALRLGPQYQVLYQASHAANPEQQEAKKLNGVHVHVKIPVPRQRAVMIRRHSTSSSSGASMLEGSNAFESDSSSRIQWRCEM